MHNFGHSYIKLIIKIIFDLYDICNQDDIMSLFFMCISFILQMKQNGLFV